VTPPVAPRVRRGLALSILFGLLLVAWEGVVSPLIGFPRERQEQIDALSEELGRLRTITARRPELERQAAAVQGQLAAEGGFWSGTSAAAMAASVQDRLRQVVSGSGGRVKSASEGRQNSASGFHEITIRFSIEGTLETVQKTLTAIETSTPALFLNGLTITAPPDHSAPDRPPVLNLDLDVTGYMRAAQS
jgi:general secretion pathway protein M